MPKGKVFYWETEQNAFNEVKIWLQKPQVLYIPENKGRFHIYLDTSKFTTGSILYQISTANSNSLC